MSRYQLQRSFTPPFVTDLAREVDHLQDSIHRMFDGPFMLGTTRFPRLETLAWVPPVEITESEAEIAMTFELPGLDKSDVKIEIDDNVLTLRGEKKSEHVEDDEKEFFLKERSYGIFERSFALPPTVNVEKVAAVFEKGVLRITMPKSEAVKARGREIAIQAK
jgi:HSP20 family protein